MLTDSKEGISLLMPWAKAHGFVLNLYHKRIALKHGVPVDGVRFSEMLQ